MAVYGNTKYYACRVQSAVELAEDIYELVGREVHLTKRQLMSVEQLPDETNEEGELYLVGFGENHTDLELHNPEGKDTED